MVAATSRVESCRALGLVVLLLIAAAPPPAVKAASGELELRVVDGDTGEPVAVRMHLKNQRGRSQRVPGVPYWHDHFVFDGRIVLKLPTGHYTFAMERGPEYKLRTGHFTIDRGATDNKQVVMERFVRMSQEGWWSGDLHICRLPQHLPLLMLAEDLHIAPVITWSNRKNLRQNQQRSDIPPVRLGTDRYYRLLAGQDERSTGSLLYYQLDEPLPLMGIDGESPSPMEFLKQAKQRRPAHVDINQPFSWDVPVWLASGKVDSIGLLNSHLWRDGVLDHEAGGKPRDKTRYPAPHGNGRWSQEIYYHLLNCGLRLPPAAGSGSGVAANPVGYNRVYVFCGDELSYDSWWEGLRAGRVVVTNGPLMRPRVNGRLPGHVFRSPQGETLELDVQLKLSTRDRIDYLEIVKNGRSVVDVRLDQWAKAGGVLPSVEFTESGWLLVRAVTTNEKTYRYASSGPYYVQVGDQPRISKQSAQFFLDWVYERARQIKIEDSAARAAVMRYHRAARDFWQQRVAQANCE